MSFINGSLARLENKRSNIYIPLDGEQSSILHVGSGSIDGAGSARGLKKHKGLRWWQVDVQLLVPTASTAAAWWNRPRHTGPAEWWRFQAQNGRVYRGQAWVNHVEISGGINGMLTVKAQLTGTGELKN